MNIDYAELEQERKQWMDKIESMTLPERKKLDKTFRNSGLFDTLKKLNAVAKSTNENK